MIRDKVFYEELSPEAYQKLIRVEGELREEGVETFIEQLVAVAVDMVEEEEWKRKIIEAEKEF